MPARGVDGVDARRGGGGALVGDIDNAVEVVASVRGDDRYAYGRVVDLGGAEVEDPDEANIVDGGAGEPDFVPVGNLNAGFDGE